jgi:hypothetical protein
MADFGRRTGIWVSQSEFTEGWSLPSAGKVLFSVTHPLQFLPYLYEGFSPMERLILRSTDISIRLIDTQIVP